MFGKKKKKRAIQVLNQLLNEIESITNVTQGENWKAKLKDTLNLYVGENSEISKRLNHLRFTREETRVDPDGFFYYVDVYDDTLKKDFKDLICNAINHVRSNGVYENPDKKNFLHSFSNAEIISGSVSIILLVFGIGNYFGKLEKDREIMQIETKIKDVEKANEALNIEKNHLKQLNDSLQKVVTTLTNKPLTINQSK